MVFRRDVEKILKKKFIFLFFSILLLVNTKLWSLTHGNANPAEPGQYKDQSIDFANRCGLLLLDALTQNNISLLKPEPSALKSNCKFLQDVSEFKESLMLVAVPFPTTDSYQITVASVGMISIPSFVEMVS